MKASTLRSTRITCNVAFGFWCIWALVFVLRLLRYCGIITFNVYLGIDIVPITWVSDEGQSVAQWIELVGYVVTSAVILWFAFLFIRRTQKGLTTGEIFTHSNARALRWMAPLVFFHILFTDNITILYGRMQLYIGSTPFVASMLTLIVAMLYSLAYSAQEENRLTI